MSNNMFSKSNDKQSAIGALILYVHRSRLVGKAFDKTLINDVMNLIRSKSPVITEMKDTLTEIMNTDDLRGNDLIDLVILTVTYDTDTTNRMKLLLSRELTDDEIKKYLETATITLRHSCNVLTAVAGLNNASFKLNTSELDIESQEEILTMLKEQLDEMHLKKKTGNSDEIESLSLSSNEILDSLNSSEVKKKKLKFGIEELNRAVAGGVSGGEMVVIEALQHRNKTGFTLSLLLQLILNNKYEKQDDGKSPMFMWISLEDDLSQIIIKIFIYLYFRKHKSMPVLLELDNNYINKFIRTEIYEETGVELILKRVDSAKFNIEYYEEMCSIYEDKGYYIVCTAVDYLEKAYLENSKFNTGATGSGLKNMFTIFRTYIQRKNILFMTPHQFAPSAIDVLRGDISDVDYLKMLKGKNHTQGSRGLPQEFDVEIMIHLCEINGIDYQSVQIGKLKRPEYVNPKHKSLLIPFEKNLGTGLSTMNGPLMESISSTNPVLTDADEVDDGQISL